MMRMPAQIAPAMVALGRDLGIGKAVLIAWEGKGIPLNGGM